MLLRDDEYRPDWDDSPEELLGTPWHVMLLFWGTLFGGELLLIYWMVW